MKKPSRASVRNATIIAIGFTTGAVVYHLGVTTGVKLDSLTRDVVASQLVLTKLRETNPEIVDKAVADVITQLDGIIAASAV